MKYKTSELTGQNLRRAVALACGYRVEREDGDGSDWVAWFPPEDVPRLGPCSSLTEHGFAPDIKWEQGGPIIDMEMIQLKPWRKEMRHIASWTAKTLDGHEGDGHTALIAAMRAYVASKFGEEVELP